MWAWCQKASMEGAIKVGARKLVVAMVKKVINLLSIDFKREAALGATDPGPSTAQQHRIAPVP